MEQALLHQNYMEQQYCLCCLKLKSIYKEDDSVFLAIIIHVCRKIKLLKIDLINYGSGFQLLLKLKVVLTISTTTVVIVLLLQLFSYCCVGDYLKCQMEEIADSIYSSNWYCLPAKLMRNILLVIMRSQQPVQLLAGKFFTVNIKTYMTILKTSLSYFSVLRVMMDT
ncbi:odorant receptor 30a [Solenopsis invicta]|uniref:odorant receptor 30a n=1 Tax=Solenopsis invicta TaxID=13686 RepID=UPI00193DBBA2|nr:odorant receptor 30a [Solenopsis invicta]